MVDETKEDISTDEQEHPNSVPVEEFLAEQLGADHSLLRPLTDEEARTKARREQMERDRAHTLTAWTKYAEPHVEEANRLLCHHEANEEELEKLRRSTPLPHHRNDPLPAEGEEDPHQCSRKCWAWLLQPLSLWPSDLLRIYGPVLLFHPLVTEAIRRISKFASDPLLVHNPDPISIAAENQISAVLEQVPEGARDARRRELLEETPLAERGFSAVRLLDSQLRLGVALRDETEDLERYEEARRELQRIVAALAPNRERKPRSHRPIRVLIEFEDRRADGAPEKNAVSSMARESGRSEAAIRSDIRAARKTLGRRKIPKHHRGRFRQPPEKS